MSVLKYFKTTPRSPYGEATGPKCNFFFFKFATRFLAKKTGACRPLNGRRGPVAHPRGDCLPPTSVTILILIYGHHIDFNLWAGGG